jgi:hypothetical protein
MVAIVAMVAMAMVVVAIMKVVVVVITMWSQSFFVCVRNFISVTSTTGVLVIPFPFLIQMSASCSFLRDGSETPVLFSTPLLAFIHLQEHLPWAHPSAAFLIIPIALQSTVLYCYSL